METVLQAANDAWTTHHQYILRTGDTVMVLVMVTYNDVLYKRNEDLKIGNDGRAFLTIQSDDINKSNEYGSNTCSGSTTEPPNNCMYSDTTTNSNQKYCVDEIIFEENFKSDELKKTHWSHDIHIALNDLETEEFVLFDNNRVNHFIQNGILHIKPTVQKTVKGEIKLEGGRCTGLSKPNCKRRYQPPFIILPPVHSTKIHTNRKFAFKYGRVEIRAKLPKGDWIIPYIKLQPVSRNIDFLNKHDQIPQIRIAFARGNEYFVPKGSTTDIGGKHLCGGIDYYVNGACKNDLKSTYNKEHYGERFHVYSITWSKERIKLAVDGNVYGEITENLEDFQNDQFYIVLGVSVGGQIHFPNNHYWLLQDPRAAMKFWDKRNEWLPTWNGNEALQVDYVKVYAL